MKQSDTVIRKEVTRKKERLRSKKRKMKKNKKSNFGVLILLEIRFGEIPKGSFDISKLTDHKDYNATSKSFNLKGIFFHLTITEIQESSPDEIDFPFSNQSISKEDKGTFLSISHSLYST